FSPDLIGKLLFLIRGKGQLSIQLCRIYHIPSQVQTQHSRGSSIITKDQAVDHNQWIKGQWVQIDWSTAVQGGPYSSFEKSQINILAKRIIQINKVAHLSFKQAFPIFKIQALKVLKGGIQIIVLNFG